MKNRHVRPEIFIVKKIIIFVFLFFSFLSLNIHASEDNPSACNCNTIVIGDQEEQGGCPLSVKRETCPKFREMENWQMRLRQQQKLKDLEDRMNPGHMGALPR